MEGTTRDDDDLSVGHVNGGTVSDDDVRAMLSREREKSTRLARDLETERSGRNRAESQAASQTTARFDAEEAAVAAKLAGAETEAATLRRQYADALAEGRFEEVSEINDKLVAVRADQQQAKQYQTWLTAEKQRLAAPAPAPHAGGVDLSLYSAKQRAWIKQNPDFMESEQVRKLTVLGHHTADVQGIEVDSPAYFRLIDKTVREGLAPAAADDTDDTPFSDTGAAAAPPRAPPVDMPVTRSQPRQAARQREVRLTADEMEAADITIGTAVPVQGHSDRDGVWHPGRYELYAIQRQRLKARGQG